MFLLWIDEFLLHSVLLKLSTVGFCYDRCQVYVLPTYVDVRKVDNCGIKIDFFDKSNTGKCVVMLL